MGSVYWKEKPKSTFVPERRLEALLKEIIKVTAHVGEGWWQIVWLWRVSGRRRISGWISQRALWRMFPFISVFTCEGVTECHCYNEICWWPSSRIPNTAKDHSGMGKKSLTLRTAVIAARWNLIIGNIRCLHLGTNSWSYSCRLSSSLEKEARTSRMKRGSISWSLGHLDMCPEKTCLWWQSIQVKMNPCLDDCVNF